MADFYTYLWNRPDGTPYYVGKGTGLRAFRSKAHTVKSPIGKTKSHARVLIQYWPDEATAFEMEKWYIRFYGRKDNGTGILRNRTDGGEGSANVPPEVRKKRSAASKARWADPEFRERTCRQMRESHQDGFTPEHLANMSRSRKGKPNPLRRGQLHTQETKDKMKAAWVERKTRLESGEELHWTQRR